ncbi:SDR family NAD(P)-dependent oxidoreductase [Trichococcus sp.]|uniref:SDR family NAD(P)-dependent oxidoreductase n=1 Tax=Trichococcus sp. TaxID=1985464 RepID=UPI003C7D0A09
MTNKIALITGASAGIGQEFAKKLSQQGYDLILVARREDRLVEISKQLTTKSEIITADLAKAEECFRLYEETKDKNISILINCAGFGDFGAFTTTSLDKELEMIDVNIKAVHILTKKFLPDMIARNEGYILNVASVAGLMPAGPYMATYYATKAYVTSFTSAIAEELEEKKSNVYVGSLCPGPVDTEFNQVADVKFNLKGITSEYCVNYALDKMYKRKKIIVPTMLLKGALFSSKLAPRNLVVRLTSRQQKKKQG